MVDYVAGCKLVAHLVYGNAHLHHQHHYVIGKVGNFVYRFFLIVGFSCDNYLGTFLAYLFQNFIQSTKQ